ncbi:MAG: caspase family protein [Flavobacterium sp.]|nr:caspase family protein [Flavobacterium sp.]
MAKKAVIIGVNDYAPIGSGGPDLNGCVNDARDMANTLVICGFPALNIRILTNQNATKSNILNYLTWLVTTSKKGDSLVFYYSGHGTRVANIGTDFEIDGLDDAICPHDFATAGVIRDDDFSAIIKKLPTGVNLDVIFDCCHSGTGTRKLSLVDFDGNPVNETARFIQPDLENEFYFNHARELAPTKKSNSKTSKSVVTAGTMNHVLFAACKDSQVAMEGDVGGLTRGYFTYNLCKALRATNGSIKRSLLDTQIANALSAMGAAQTNQTEGKSTELNQNIFA